MKSTIAEPRRDHLASLTGLRFVAAFVVLLRHTVEHFFPLPGLIELSFIGTIGVGFFFVLSGFILAWTWKPARNRGDFYMRRIARIAPLHVLTTLIAFGMLVAAGTPMWASSIASLFLVQAWLTEPYRLGGNAPSWSLSVEAFFYLLFPFMIRPMMNSAVRRCVWIATLAFAWMLAWTALYMAAGKLDLFWLSAFSGYTNPAYRIGEFIIGIALASAMKQGWRIRLSLKSAAWLSLGCYVGLAAVNGVVMHTGLALGKTQGIPLSLLDLAYLPVTVLLIAAAAGADLRGESSAFGGKIMVLLGRWSFALYLVQSIIIAGALWLLGHTPVSIQGASVLIAVILASVGASAALHHWVEVPMERALSARKQDDRAPVPSVR